MKKKIMLFNPARGGVCRTIKADYYKMSMANFVDTGSFGATGVITIEVIDNEKDNKQADKKPT